MKIFIKSHWTYFLKNDLFIPKVYGGAGVSGDFPLARALAGMRTLRIADGPDAVHQRTIALLEIKKAKRKLGDAKSKL